MSGLTDLQTATLSTIRDFSSIKPITGTAIARIIGLKERKSGKDGADMRSIIHALRVKGYPICATGAGYWWPKDQGELQVYIESFQNRVNDQQAAVDGLRLGMKHIAATKPQILLSAAPPVPIRTSRGVAQVPADRVEEFLAAHPGAEKL